MFQPNALLGSDGSLYISVECEAGHLSSVCMYRYVFAPTRFNGVQVSGRQ